ncbi:MAG: NlpC/P60 family protein [Eubacteriales bacterium]|nr:NlpC/P60 family protein [Eubacteriales bacterium]
MRNVKSRMVMVLLLVVGVMLCSPMKVYAETSAVIDDQDGDSFVVFKKICLKLGKSDVVGLGKFANQENTIYTYRVGSYDDYEDYYNGEAEYNNVLTVSENGKVKAVGIGCATIHVFLSDLEGNLKSEIVIPVVVSKPKLVKSKIAWKVKSYASVGIQGLSLESDVELYDENGKKLKTMYLYDDYDYDEDDAGIQYCNISTGKKCGTKKYVLRIDGMDYPLEITATKPKLKEKDKIVVVKLGGKTSLHFTGIDKKLSKVEYETYDTDLFTGSKATIKGKKVGTTYAYVTVDGEQFQIIVSVQKGKVYKAVSYAAKQVGVAKYSQAKRARKGYYDCSSLVWRSYEAAGIRIGNSSWALNSDGLAAAYYKKKGHFIGTNITNMKKVRSGDIIIRGTINKGIPSTTHAALYIGNGYTIEAKNEEMGIALGYADYAPIVVRPVK